MKKLKPCPFCGEDYAHDFNGAVYCTGMCRDKGAMVKIPISTWQSRPIEDTLNRRITDLESALKNMRHILATIEDPYPYLGESYKKYSKVFRQAEKALGEKSVQEDDSDD